VKLCREQSAYRIARWLRLNDAALRERVRRADAGGRRPRPMVARAPSVRFVELVAAPGASGVTSGALAPEYVLEAGGVRVRVRGAPVAEVAALARALGTDTGTGTGTDKGEVGR
jgi:hypothetical protein